MTSDDETTMPVAAAAVVVEKKACGACQQDMSRDSFSKKQWERKKFRRCKECVEHEIPFQRPSKNDYNESKPPEEEEEEEEKAEATVITTTQETVTPPQPSMNTLEEDHKTTIFHTSTQELLDYKVEAIDVEEEINDLLHAPSEEEEEATPSSPNSNADDHSEATTEPIQNSARNQGDSIISSSIQPTDSIESDAQHWDPSAMMMDNPSATSTRPPQPSVPPPAAPNTTTIMEGEEGQGRVVQRPCWCSPRILTLMCFLSVFGLVISSLVETDDDHVPMLVFAGFAIVLAAIMLLYQLYGRGYYNSDTNEESSLTEPLLSGEGRNNNDEIV